MEGCKEGKGEEITRRRVREGEAGTYYKRRNKQKFLVTDGIRRMRGSSSSDRGKELYKDGRKNGKCREEIKNLFTVLF